jgi:RNA polymerase sigma-70 factor (ECF subfamily)
MTRNAAANAASSLGGISDSGPKRRRDEDVAEIAVDWSQIPPSDRSSGLLGETEHSIMRDRGEGQDAMDADRERRFEALVSEHRNRAIGLAWRLLGNDRAAAEDVAQEAFLRAYRGLARFRGDSKLSTWFYRILVNEVQRHRRWRWVREGVSGPMPDDEPRDPAPKALSDPLMRDRVAQALDGLPRGQREAFVLVHLEGLTIREAGELTGRAVGTMKSHLHRAVRKMRAELSDLESLFEAGEAGAKVLERATPDPEEGS